jgi:dUTPase
MNDRLEIRFHRLRPHEDADIPPPQYMTPGAAGINLAAALDTPLVLAPGDMTLLPRKEGTSVAGMVRKAIDAYNSDIPADKG